MRAVTRSFQRRLIAPEGSRKDRVAINPDESLFNGTKVIANPNRNGSDRFQSLDALAGIARALCGFSSARFGRITDCRDEVTRHDRS